MNKPTAPLDFFNKEAAEKYDERNSKLSRISDCLHFLTTLVVKDLPTESRILCVGVGTGAEIVSLAQTFPQWTFVALDPSKNMLDVCHQRLQNMNLADRCEFIHGYVHDYKGAGDFDAVLSILVGHFVKHDEKPNFFRTMVKLLRPGGYLVNAEISFDLNSDEFPIMLKGWEQVQTLMGATPESLATLPFQLKEMLSVSSEKEIENLLRASGIETPIRFFQAFMISAWWGKK
jgi:tRNA (cmo5U34)-methyltransferase